MALGHGRKDDSIRNEDGFVAEAPGAGVTLLGHCGPFCPGIINSELGRVFCGASLAKFSRVKSDSCPQRHGEGGMDPGEGKTTEIKSFNTRIKGSNYPAMAGVGDQESPVFGGRSSWAQGANHHFNTYLVMFMPGGKNLWHPTSFGHDFQEEICP